MITYLSLLACCLAAAAGLPLDPVAAADATAFRAAASEGAALVPERTFLEPLVAAVVVKLVEVRYCLFAYMAVK